MIRKGRRDAAIPVKHRRYDVVDLGFLGGRRSILQRPLVRKIGDKEIGVIDVFRWHADTDRFVLRIRPCADAADPFTRSCCSSLYLGTIG
jgi:hypothetical protein